MSSREADGVGETHTQTRHEEKRHRRWDFLVMLLFGAASLLAGVGIGGGNARFLGHNLSCFLVYIWARTYEGQEVAVMEFFTIRAELLPSVWKSLRRPSSPERHRADAVTGTTRPKFDFHAGSRGSSRRRPTCSSTSRRSTTCWASPSATRTRSCGSGSASRRRARCAPSTRRGRSSWPSTRRSPRSSPSLSTIPRGSFFLVQYNASSDAFRA